MRRLTQTSRLVAVALAHALVGCYTGLPEGQDSGAGEASSSGEAGSGAESSSSGGDASTSGTSGPETTTAGVSDGGSTTGEEMTSTTTTGEDSTTTTGEDSTTTTGDPTTTSTGGDSTSTSTSTSGGQGAYCDGDDAWMAGWASLEDQVLELVNQRRAQGANCGGQGSFGPAGALTMDPLLRCAARLHSKDMVDRNFFSHTNPDGESPWDRIAKTGYGSYQNAGENIAAGSATAAGVMQQWMSSDGHCANIMNPAFNWIGVGYYPGGGYGHYWTQVFTKK